MRCLDANQQEEAASHIHSFVCTNTFSFSTCLPSRSPFLQVLLALNNRTEHPSLQNAVINGWSMLTSVLPASTEVFWWYEHLFSCSYKSYCNRFPTGPAQPEQKLNFTLYYFWNTWKSQIDILQGNFLQTITTVEKLDKMLWGRRF